MSRHKLPAPPLVLQPQFARVRAGSSRAALLLDAALFLRDRGLLTDGGCLNLERGLAGRGQMLSLTTQDVRAPAHGLTLDLLEQPDRAVWPQVAEAYYGRYDRGKPRRPTRLQRLFLQWSPDLGPFGMLEVCRFQPHLWDDVRAALAVSTSDDRDHRLLSLALGVRDSHSAACWFDAFESWTEGRRDLLRLLPLLPYPSFETRLGWLASQVAAGGENTAMSGQLETWSDGLLLACRRGPGESPVTMPPPLVRLTLALFEGSRGEVDPCLLGILRFYRWPAQALQKLKASLHPDDPVHRIEYGPRPCRPWLGELWEVLEHQAEPSTRPL